jgi:hypothetical protein
MKKCYEEKDLIKTAQIEYVSELEKLIEKTENCGVVVNTLTKQRDELMEICKLVFVCLVYTLVFKFCFVSHRSGGEGGARKNY